MIAVYASDLWPGAFGLLDVFFYSKVDMCGDGGWVAGFHFPDGVRADQQ